MKSGCKRSPRRLRPPAGSTSIFRLDVTEYAEVGRVVNRTIRELGRIDVLCNNAGINTANGPVAEIPPERFATVFAVNTVGLYACCYAVLPHMIAQGYGRIVNVSSASAFMCQPGSAAYAGSKAAVNALTAALAKEVQAHDILVNAMSPGAVRTDMNPTADTHPVEAVPTAVWLAALSAGRANGPVLPLYGRATDAAGARYGLHGRPQQIALGQGPRRIPRPSRLHSNDDFCKGLTPTLALPRCDGGATVLAVKPWRRSGAASPAGPAALH